jgi:hypothetical protein
VNPWTSGFVFITWMHCVYTSIAYVPVHLLIAMNLVLYSNYQHFVKGADFTAGFPPLTVSELLKCILFGDETTNYLKPMNVASRDTSIKSSKNTPMRPVDYMVQHSSIRVDEDHVEFPCSQRARYPKATLAEACWDAQDILLDQIDSNQTKSSLLASKSNIRASIIKFLTNGITLTFIQASCKS